MALAEDGSTPTPVVTSAGFTTATFATASFTPPANSMLVVLASIGYTVAWTTAPTLTPSATGVTFTQAGYTTENTSKFEAEGTWWAYLPTSPGAITVTITRNTTDAAQGLLAVRVITGMGTTPGGQSLMPPTDTVTTATALSVAATAVGSLIYTMFTQDNTAASAATGLANTTALLVLNNGVFGQGMIGVSTAASTASTSYGFSNSTTGTIHTLSSFLEVVAASGTTPITLADSGSGTTTLALTAQISDWTGVVSATTPGGTPITLTDTGAGTAALAVAAAIPLADTGAGVATLAVTEISDWTGVVSATTPAGGGSTPITLTDAGSGTDVLAVAAAVPLADTGSGTDALSVTVAPTLTSRTVGIPISGVMPFTVRTASTTSVRIKVGTDSGVTAGVIFGSSGTPNAQGDTQLSVSGLAAGTSYFYRVAMTNGAGPETLDGFSSVGTFKTAPSGPASFAFSFGSCTDNTDSTALGAIAGRADDLFIHLGDLYYNDGGLTTVASFRTQVSNKIQATSHAAVFGSRACAYTPSDHEGMNNNTTAGSDPTAWTNWNSVFREMWPAPSTIPATTGCYYTFVWGRVRFIIWDGRSFASNSTATDNSSKTMLGSVQKQWTKDTINAATEPVIIIANQCPWIGTGDTDNWSAYNTERTELATFFSGITGKKIGMISGDMHAVAADDGTDAPGGVFVFHGAPLDNNTSQKGGPYTVGPSPASGTTRMQQYGRVVVTDTGSSTIGLAFTGFSAANTSLLTLTVNATATTAVSLADTGSGADALTVHAAALLADTGSGADAISVGGVPIALAETGTGTATLAVVAAVPLAETGTGTDAISVVTPIIPSIAVGGVVMASPGIGLATLASSGVGVATVTSSGADPLPPADGKAVLVSSGAGIATVQT